MCYITRIDYVNLLTNETLWTQYSPNQSAHTHAQMCLDPSTEKARLKVDGETISESTFQQALGLFDKARGSSEALAKHIKIKHHKDTLTVIDRGSQIGAVTRSRMSIESGGTSHIHIQKTSSTVPNVQSGITKTTKGVSVAASKLDYNSLKTAQYYQYVFDSKIARAVATPVKWVDRSLKAEEVTLSWINDDNQTAMGKTGKLAGGVASDFVSGSVGAAGAGLLVSAGLISAPVAIPVAIVLIALTSIATEKTFESGGEGLFKALYRTANDILEKEAGRAIVSSNLSQEFRDAAANPWSAKLNSDTVIAINKRKDGTNEHVKVSDVDLMD